MLLWFLIVVVPVAILSFTLAVDGSRMVLSRRQSVDAAEAAAVAGAFQFRPDTATLDPARARSAAEETLAVAEQSGAIRSADVLSTQVSATATTVTVTVRYRAAGLLRFESGGMRLASPERTVTRVARVCVPGRTGPNEPTGGFCTRPDA